MKVRIEQCRADDEHYSQRHLSDDKRGTKLAAANAHAGVAAIFIQGGCQIGARCADGGNEAEDESR